MRPVFSSKEYELWEEYYAIASDKSLPIDTRKRAKLQYDRLTRRGMAKAKILEVIQAKQPNKKKGNESGQVEQPEYDVAIPTIPFEIDPKDLGIELKLPGRRVPSFRGQRKPRYEVSVRNRKQTHNT